MNFRIFHILFIFMAAILLPSCQDDPFRSFGDFPEGETQVSVELDFTPFSASPSCRSSEAPAGNFMNGLTDLAVIAYTTDGQLVDGFPKEVTDFRVTMQPRTDGDAAVGKNAEQFTAHTTFKLTLPYGKYQIFAVANIGSYTLNPDGSVKTLTSSFQALSPGGKYHGLYADPSSLRTMRIGWDNAKMENNRAMLGYFAMPQNNSTPTHKSYVPTVTIASEGVSLHCWLRRCASKVTVDFDGSGLRDNVFIYPYRVTVHDIPVSCNLGFGRASDPNHTPADYIDFNNHASSTAADTPEGLIPQADWHIEFGQLSSIDNIKNELSSLPCISRGKPHITGSDGTRKDLHTENANALYFYENMQGQSEYQKQHDPDFTNLGAVCPEEKEGMTYASYIDVECYYRSSADANVSEGVIHYRFLLGKDVVKDCDAERNCHYKVTLKPRGNANEYSWHIDYEEDGPWVFPDPWFVSSLYGQQSVIPIKYSPPKGWKVTKVEAEIVENPWHTVEPCEPGEYGFNVDANKSPANGFLSLLACDQTVVTYQDNGLSGWGYSDSYKTANDNYYYGKTPSTITGEKKVHNKRTYHFDGTPDVSNTGRDAYSMAYIDDKVVFYIPLFTREKILIKQTGYTGNNPYIDAPRVAKIRLKVHLTNGFETQIIDSPLSEVTQVRRVINPKGIYRSAGNNEDFEVALKELDGMYATKFHNLVSHGPWTAEIVGDKNFIKLDGRDHISGATNTEVKFNVNFNKTHTDPNDPTVRNAVIIIKYNSFTCTHLIFVRQGYSPQTLSPDAKDHNGAAVPVKWRTCNMIHQNIEATDPRDEGSLFHFGNLDYPYDAECNIYNENLTIPSSFPAQQLKITQADGTAINGAWNPNNRNLAGFTNRNVATVHQFEQLYMTPNVEFGYGVLYGDGATKTAETTKDAYGWYRRDNPTERDKRGMRGVFIYYWDPDNLNHPYQGRNIFMPIGRQGYGHRKNKDEAILGAGILRYSSGRYANASSTFKVVAPLFCNIYIRPGAIYWIRYIADGGTYTAADLTAGSGKAYGMDFNFFTMDAGSITEANIDQGRSACFVRCVGDSYK